MPEIMPFGKMAGKSVEQICLQDYSYFAYLMRDIEIRKPSLRERFAYVHHVVNNFISTQPCHECERPARYISIYYTPMPSRTSDITHVYDSKACFEADGRNSPKGRLEPLTFDTAVSKSKQDTQQLVKIIAECMGLPRNKRLRKETLENFFDRFSHNGRLWVPYERRAPREYTHAGYVAAHSE